MRENFVDDAFCFINQGTKRPFVTGLNHQGVVRRRANLLAPAVEQIQLDLHPESLVRGFVSRRAHGILIRPPASSMSNAILLILKSAGDFGAAGSGGDFCSGAALAVWVVLGTMGFPEDFCAPVWWRINPPTIPITSNPPLKIPIRAKGALFFRSGVMMAAGRTSVVPQWGQTAGRPRQGIQCARRNAGRRISKTLFRPCNWVMPTETTQTSAKVKDAFWESSLFTCQTLVLMGWNYFLGTRHFFGTNQQLTHRNHSYERRFIVAKRD